MNFDHVEHLKDKTMRGGLMQYAREPSDLDDAIIDLRERLAIDFLEPLVERIDSEPSFDLVLCIVYIYQLVYPDSIKM